MKRIPFLVMIFLLVFVMPAFAQGKGVNLKPKTPQEWRDYLYFRRDQVLEELYLLKPEAKFVIEHAKGYAVFSSFSLKILLLGTANGRGFVHDNQTAKDVFMRQFQADVGPGIGIKDYRVVLVFDDSQAMEDFIYKGWSFGGQAAAAAKSDSEGGVAFGGALRMAPGIRAYQLTENGLVLELSLTGTKYWKDAHVNSQLK